MNSLTYNSDTELFQVPKRTEYKFKEVNMDDPRVWALYQAGDTKGLFQVESQLGKQWCKIIKPSNIDELSALLSLIRPGGLEAGMAEKFAKIKHGQMEPEYIHPSLIPILEKTYSCLVFQEQILEICVKIAGFNEVEADLARRAVGKKLPEEMMKVEKMFLEGCKKTGIVSEDIAKAIFAWIQKSVRYLFNAGHSYSYAYISYFQAYQKRFFPVEFYTASLNYSSEKIDPKIEIYELIQDARLRNIKIIPPDIQRKNADFEIVDNSTIAFGLGHIRGVGFKAIETIQGIKSLNTFNDFLRYSRKIKRNVAESLIKSGACDCYKLNRTYMLRVLQSIYGHIVRDDEELPNHLKKLTDKELKPFLDNVQLFGPIKALQCIINDKGCVSKRIPIIEQKIKFLENAQTEDTNRQKSIWEKLYLGLNITCSTADDFEKIDENIKSCRQAYFLQNKEKATVHCVIDNLYMKKTGEKSKNPGQPYCILDISDNSGVLQSVFMWPELYEIYKDDLSTDVVACISIKKNVWNGRESFAVEKITILG